MKQFHKAEWFNVCTAAAAIRDFFDPEFKEISEQLEEYPEIRVHKALSKKDADYVVTRLKGDFTAFTIEFIERYVDALTKYHMPRKDIPLDREDLILIEKTVTGDKVWVQCSYFYGYSIPYKLES